MRSFFVFVSISLWSILGLYGMEAHLNRLDEDMDGKLSFLEFSSNKSVKHVPAGQLLKLFKRFDKNEDTFLDKDEISGKFPIDIQLPLNELDENIDGKLSFFEFSLAEHVQNVPAEKLLKLFKRLDKNQDGFLDKGEISGKRLANIGVPLNELDEDIDGKLSFLEFSSAESVQNIPTEKLFKLFKRLDKNKDNLLDKKELSSKRGAPGARIFVPSKKLVKALDKNADGRISFAEYHTEAPMKKWSETQKKRIFAHLDKDQDKTISLKEFSDARKSNQKSHQLEMDVDGDGNVTLEEFRSATVIRKLPELQRKRFFNHMDKNRDGVLNKQDLDLARP